MQWAKPTNHTVSTVGPRTILHVDMNSYFATILQQENPMLRGKPVGVVKSLGRTCIIASSKEAKKLGIGTGSGLSDAKKKAPCITIVPAAFDVYLDCTHRLKQLFHSLSPSVDVFSLDEAFLDMTGCEHLYSSIENYARFVQTQVKQTLGNWVTCNVGIASNKLLAKLAGEIAPKGEVLRITENNRDSILATAPFSAVCGIGYRLEKKLLALGVNNPYAINFIDDDTLLLHFGPFWMRELKKIARGQETHFFTHIPTVIHAQSVGRTITGHGLTHDERVIKRTLLNLVEEATYKLRQMDLAGRSIALSLWGKHQHFSRMMRLKYYVRHTNEIFALLFERLYQQWTPFPVLKFGIWIGELKPLYEIPQCWLPAWNKNEKLYETIDAVNNRYGLFTLKPATLLGKGLIRPEVTGYLGDKKFHGLD